MRKKRAIILIIFIAFTGFSYDINYSKKRVNNTRYNLNITYLEQNSDKIEIKQNKINYKLIKKEIQNRRKLHRNLVISYNQNFDNSILEQIKNNSLIIEKFKNIIS